MVFQYSKKHWPSCKANPDWQTWQLSVPSSTGVVQNATLGPRHVFEALMVSGMGLFGFQRPHSAPGTQRKVQCSVSLRFWAKYGQFAGQSSYLSVWEPTFSVMPHCRRVLA